MLKAWQFGEWVGNVMHKVSITDMNSNDWGRCEALWLRIYFREFPTFVWYV